MEAAANVSNFGITAQSFQRLNNGVSNLVFCDSPFEEQVVEFLENQGFTELECQHGCGKFRIDIVVKERGKNLLAIECDGAAYHSSLVARTRDRARQRILEGRGWRGRIHRVWSTNWWYFEQQEKEAILAAIAAARQALHSAGTRADATHHPQQTPPSAVLHTEETARMPETSVRSPAAVTTQSVKDDELAAAVPPSRRSESFSQPNLELEMPRVIGESKVTTTELRNALYHFVPESGKIAREQLLEKTATHLGLPLRKARPELNRTLADEKRAGRLELDSGWEHVWRA